VAGAVISTLTGGTLKVALAPADAVAELWKERIKERLSRVGEKAERKQSGKALMINERIAFKALTEAAFVDSEVVAEYLAGVLAAAPSDSDAGAPWIAQIGRLSSLQLRLHYVFYRAVWSYARENSISPDPDGRLYYPELFFPASALQATLEIDDPVESFAVLSALKGLEHEGLLSEAQVIKAGAQVSRSGSRSSRYYRPPEAGLVLKNKAYGIELFLWGCGYSYHNPRLLTNIPEQLIEIEPPVPACKGHNLIEFPHYNDRDRSRVDRD
jgi:hypothetical protein